MPVTVQRELEFPRNALHCKDFRGVTKLRRGASTPRSRCDEIPGIKWRVRLACSVNCIVNKWSPLARAPAISPPYYLSPLLPFFGGVKPSSRDAISRLVAYLAARISWHAE